MSSSSNSPCAACKFLRRKCMPTGCIFAPYFPPDNPTKFIHVHRVFGASNVSKLLNELSPAQREDAVNSLAYEAEARLHDPVLGCVGYISLLQHRLMQLQRDLSAAKRELSLCICPGPQNQFYAEAMAVRAGLAGQGSASTSAAPPMYKDQQHHQYQHHHHQQQQQQQMMVEIQQLAEVVAAEREHEMLRRREHEILRSIEQQHVLARLIGDGSSGGAAAAEASPPLALVSPHISGFEGSFAELQHQQGLQFQEGSGLRLHHNFHQRRRFDEERSGEGPSS
ncbi:protein ASYMMETRIC LEAVES 2 [Dendrobium catenatum]|uniref:LOB domain-containing protein 6 n=1 Tax=Dendrobium catenatum TaxID=906689 RepID=A0A2I0WZA4_9ASPA|nr:protein ASYMMETRIC LEAVES 2 [Dendrobium catenatum]PKU80985.1 LOB domain-containing protein 6 [Dendrobium catenatum]